MDSVSPSTQRFRVFKLHTICNTNFLHGYIIQTPLLSAIGRGHVMYRMMGEMGGSESESESEKGSYGKWATSHRRLLVHPLPASEPLARRRWEHGGRVPAKILARCLARYRSQGGE